MSEMIAISLREYLDLNRQALALTAIQNALADDVSEKTSIPYSISVRTDIVKYANPALYDKLENICEANRIKVKREQEQLRREQYEAYAREHEDEPPKKSYL